MNLKNKMIMEEYYKEKANFLQLADVVSSELKKTIEDNHIDVLAVEHRVKEEKSLIGKLELKGDKYSDLSEVTDILGARIVTFFSDAVDDIAHHIEEMFEIDWENSVDKRKVLNPDTFGYLSLHYICYLPSGGKYPENICGKKFEIQIRSSLQHTWSVINHDMGYKNEFGVPKTIVRDFSRIAGLLEIADDQFVNIRNNMTKYCDDVRHKIANNEAETILIDMVSLKEYISHNKKMREFLNELAALSGAEISEINPINFIEQLSFLGFKTLGDLQSLLEKHQDTAMKLAKKSLEHSDLDILSSTSGLRFLCRAYLVDDEHTLEEITKFINLSINNEKRAMRQASYLMETYKNFKGA